MDMLFGMLQLPLPGEKYGVPTIVYWKGETYRIERLRDIRRSPAGPPYFWLGEDAE